MKASSSVPKGPRGQIVGFECTEAFPWSWVSAGKSDLKKGLFGKGMPGSKVCRPAFWQLTGLASGYSVGHGVNTAP